MGGPSGPATTNHALRGLCRASDVGLTGVGTRPRSSPATEGSEDRRTRRRPAARRHEHDAGRRSSPSSSVSVAETTSLSALVVGAADSAELARHAREQQRHRRAGGHEQPSHLHARQSSTSPGEGDVSRTDAGVRCYARPSRRPTVATASRSVTLATSARGATAMPCAAAKRTRSAVVLHRQLAVHVRAVGLDRLHADAEPARDVLAGRSQRRPAGRLRPPAATGVPGPRRRPAPVDSLPIDRSREPALQRRSDVLAAPPRRCGSLRCSSVVGCDFNDVARRARRQRLRRGELVARSP